MKINSNTFYFHSRGSFCKKDKYSKRRFFKIVKSKEDNNNMFEIKTYSKINKFNNNFIQGYFDKISITKDDSEDYAKYNHHLCALIFSDERKIKKVDENFLH